MVKKSTCGKLDTHCSTFSGVKKSDLKIKPRSPKLRFGLLNHYFYNITPSCAWVVQDILQSVLDQIGQGVLEVSIPLTVLRLVAGPKMPWSSVAHVSWRVLVSSILLPISVNYFLAKSRGVVQICTVTETTSAMWTPSLDETAGSVRCSPSALSCAGVG